MQLKRKGCQAVEMAPWLQALPPGVPGSSPSDACFPEHCQEEPLRTEPCVVPEYCWVLPREQKPTEIIQISIGYSLEEGNISATNFKNAVIPSSSRDPSHDLEVTLPHSPFLSVSLNTVFH